MAWALEILIASTGPNPYEWEVVEDCLPLLTALDFGMRQQMAEYLHSYRLRNLKTDDTIDLKGLLGLEIRYLVKTLHVQDAFTIGSVLHPGRRGSLTRP